jgi:hypothetical protein
MTQHKKRTGGGKKRFRPSFEEFEDRLAADNLYSPIAAPDTFFVDEDVLFTAPYSVLTNDYDEDGDPLTAVLVTGPEVVPAKVFGFIEPPKGERAFLIKNWQFPDAGTLADRKIHTGPVSHKYVNVPSPGRNPLLRVAVGNKYSWDVEQVEDRGGIAGQNNEDPRAMFINHAVVVITVGGKEMMFDPSYQKDYDPPAGRTALQQFQDGA